MAFTLLFSLFLSSFMGSSEPIKASSSTVEQTVAVKNVYKSDDYFYLSLDEDLEVVSITYEYASYNDLGTKVSQLVNKSEDIIRAQPGVYRFYAPDNAIALKVWKVQYAKSSKYFPNHRTTGSITWIDPSDTGFTSAVRIKTLEVTDDKLVRVQSGVCSSFLKNVLENTPINFYKSVCDNAYFLYFNLNAEEEGIDIDYLYRASVEYTTYKRKKVLWGLHKWSADYTTHVKDIYSTESEKIYKGIKHKNQFALGESDLKGYQYMALVDITEGKKSNVLGAYTYETYMEDVAVLNITYVVDGEFINSEVLDFPTGHVVYNPSMWDRIKDWCSNHMKQIIIVSIIVIALLVLSKLFGGLINVIKAPFELLSWLFVPKKK